VLPPGPAPAPTPPPSASPNDPPMDRDLPPDPAADPADIVIGQRPTPDRRGPHPSIALGGFAALIGAAMVVVLGLLAVAFLLDRIF